MNQAELKKCAEKLKYDPDTGEFTWLVGRRGTAKAGTIAGGISTARGKKYRLIMVDGTRYRAHHLAWLFAHGVMPTNELDHINGDGLDNRISNLRLVSHKENAKNQKKPSNNTSGVVGVYFSKAENKWKAMICVDYKPIWLGTFVEKSEAIKARKEAELEHGFHKNHGQ